MKQINGTEESAGELVRSVRTHLSQVLSRAVIDEERCSHGREPKHLILCEHTPARLSWKGETRVPAKGHTGRCQRCFFKEGWLPKYTGLIFHERHQLDRTHFKHACVVWTFSCRHTGVRGGGRGRSKVQE